LNWIELNWIELHWIALNWIAVHTRHTHSLEDTKKTRIFFAPLFCLFQQTNSQRSIHLFSFSALLSLYFIIITIIRTRQREFGMERGTHTNIRHETKECSNIGVQNVSCAGAMVGWYLLRGGVPMVKRLRCNLKHMVPGVVCPHNSVMNTRCIVPGIWQKHLPDFAEVHTISWDLFSRKINYRHFSLKNLLVSWWSPINKCWNVLIWFYAQQAVDWQLPDMHASISWVVEQSWREYFIDVDRWSIISWFIRLPGIDTNHHLSLSRMGLESSWFGRRGDCTTYRR